MSATSPSTSGPSPAGANVAAMLEARSVAVVGASARPNSFGDHLMRQLVDGGFSGEVHPVNPRYKEVGGRACVASLEDVPGPVDLAILGVPNARIEEQLRLAVEVGARSAVIFASCYDDPPPGTPPLVDRLTAIASEAGIPLCGGNCMGFLNPARRLRACGYPMPLDADAGHVTFISHSGSAFAAMAYNDRRLRFNLVVSSGQELVTTAADYLSYAVEQESTRAVGMFLETVRDPAGFQAALAKAAHRDVPVLVLKVGRNERARALVAAHSGALAGDDGAYEALFDAYGVLRVFSLDEMADALELFVAGRRAGPGALASVHDSGGERAHFVDAAAQVEVDFATIGEETRRALEDTLEEGLPPVNPLDAWGTGNDYEAIYERCISALLDDPDTAALALVVDLTTEMYPEGGYVKVAKEIWAASTKPFGVLSNMASAVDRRDAASLRTRGVPVLEGTLTGLSAFRHLFAYRDRLIRAEGDHPVDTARASRWRARLRSGDALSEVEGLTLLRDYGLEVVAADSASTCEDAARAAERIGYPVALKTAAAGVAHKTDAGGVRLAISSEQELRSAYSEMAARLGPSVTIAGMAPAGVELALGVVRDDQFGPLVVVAAGGVLVELVGDRRLALPPLDPRRARRLLDGLRVRRLLDGLRGAPRADIDAVVRAVVAVGQLAAELGDDLEALDVNPVIAGSRGCPAVDALVVTRAQPGQSV